MLSVRHLATIMVMAPTDIRQDRSDGAVTSDKIARNAVDSVNIKDSTIGRDKIDPNFVLLDTSLMGTDTIESGKSSVTVFNSEVNGSCLIFLTVEPTIDSVPAIKVNSVSHGSFFEVGTIDNSNAPADIPFKYLIIKP